MVPESDEPTFNPVLHVIENNDDVLEEGKTTSYAIAEFVMDEFTPGFVIVGSPYMAMTSTGHMHPKDIGIVTNDAINLTRTELAHILLVIAAQLGEEMFKIEQFVKDATNK